MQQGIDSTISTLFKGLAKNPKKESFHGQFGLLRLFIDPVFITSNIEHIELSVALHQLLVDYCNLYSNITFAYVKRFGMIPITINESFEDSRMELHFPDHILIETINL